MFPRFFSSQWNTSTESKHHVPFPSYFNPFSHGTFWEEFEKDLLVGGAPQDLFSWRECCPELKLTYAKWKWNESGFRPPLCTYRLNWARRTSWGWWDDWDDTVLQTQNSKFKPWRSEAEHATSRSQRLPTILTFTRGWGRNIFCFFETAETGNRTPNSVVKGSGANHYPRAPAQAHLCKGSISIHAFGPLMTLGRNIKATILTDNNFVGWQCKWWVIVNRTTAQTRIHTFCNNGDCTIMWPCNVVQQCISVSHLNIWNRLICDVNRKLCHQWWFGTLSKVPILVNKGGSSCRGHGQLIISDQ